MTQHLLTILGAVVLAFPALLNAEPSLGAILPLTGDFGRYGQKVREGIESAGPLPARFVWEDEGCNPRAAISAYRKLSDVDGIKIFFGPWCGSPQTAVAPLIGKAGQLAILGSSAPRRVFTLSNGHMISAQHSIEQESLFNATEAYKLGARKVVILFLENDFSRAHEAAFREGFQGEVLETLTYNANDASSLRALATRIRRLNPDTLYIPDAFPLMHGILKEVRNIGLDKLRVMSVYSAQSDDVLDAVGPFGEGLLLSYPQIGEENALVHFPKIAAQMLAFGLSKCRADEADCVLNTIKSQYRLDQNGVLEGSLGLKIINNGKFSWLADK